jgi:hypothetical protein
MPSKEQAMLVSLLYMAIPGAIAGAGELALRPSSLAASAAIGGGATALVKAVAVAKTGQGGTKSGDKVTLVIFMTVLGAVAALAAAASAEKAGLSASGRAALVAVAVTIAQLGQVLAMGL